jgi:hypothetical protein
MYRLSESSRGISRPFQVSIHALIFLGGQKEFDALIYVVPRFFSVAMAIRIEPRIDFRNHEPKFILPNIEMALTKKWIALLYGIFIVCFVPFVPI